MCAVRQTGIEELWSCALGFQNRGVGGWTKLTEPVYQRARRIARSEKFQPVGANAETQSFSVELRRGDCGGFFRQQGTIPVFDRLKFAGCKSDLFDAGNLIGMCKVLRNTLTSRRQILDQKWRDTSLAAGHKREQPLQLITVRPLARPRNRVCLLYTSDAADE